MLPTRYGFSTTVVPSARSYEFFTQYKGIHDNCKFIIHRQFSILTDLSDANGKRDECLIGMLSDEGIKAMEEDAARAAEELAKIKAERHGAALQPDVFTLAKLVNRKELSSDTRYVVGGLDQRVLTS